MLSDHTLDPAWSFLFTLDAVALQDVVANETHLYVAVELVAEEVVMDHLDHVCPACVAEALLNGLSDRSSTVVARFRTVDLTVDRLLRGDRIDGALVGLKGVPMELISIHRVDGQIRLMWRKVDPHATDGLHVVHRHPLEHLTVERGSAA